MRNLHLKQQLDIAWPDRLFVSIYQEDQLVLDFFKHKNKGYCIDMGAADGVSHNNCFKLFNTPYEWDGLSIEANPRFSDQLTNLFKDTEVKVCFNVVGPSEGECSFAQMQGDRCGHSNINSRDMYLDHNIITVISKPINQILEEYNVPTYIDYISMDIEGAEKYVFEKWDFEKYKVKMWCIENGDWHRDILEKHGYIKYDTPYIKNKYELNDANHFYIHPNL